MTKPKVSRYSAGDIVKAEERFAETDDPMFLVLAIGERPHLPPTWAVEACIAFHDGCLGHFKRGGEPDRMGRRLNAMWRFYLSWSDSPERDARRRRTRNRGPSVRAAATHAIKDVDKEDEDSPGFEAKLRKVQRAWALEQQFVEPVHADYELFDGLVSTPRFARIFQEWGTAEFGGLTGREAVKALFRRKRDE